MEKQELPHHNKISNTLMDMAFENKDKHKEIMNRIQKAIEQIEDSQYEPEEVIIDINTNNEIIFIKADTGTINEN